MQARTHTHTHTHTLTHVHQNPGTRAHPQGQFSQQLPSVQGPALIGIPPPCPPPCPLGGRVGRLPQGGPPGHTCCAPDPGLGLPAPPRLWAVEAAGHSRMAILTMCSRLSLSTSPTRGSREPFSSQLKRLRPHRAPPRGTELSILSSLVTCVHSILNT